MNYSEVVLRSAGPDESSRTFQHAKKPFPPVFARLSASAKICECKLDPGAPPPPHGSAHTSLDFREQQTGQDPPPPRCMLGKERALWKRGGGRSVYAAGVCKHPFLRR